MTAVRFRWWMLLIVVVYVAIELVYMQSVPIVMDEFDGVYDAYRLRHDVPYRDFRPYKTVLGYYIQLPATFAASSVWGRILALKMEMIAINVLMLVAAAAYCSRFLSRRAVLIASALLVASTPMLERSTEIRVDMLTAWAGLWSFLFLVRRRYALAGFLCTLSFAISQKAALYVIASNAVLVAAIFFDEDRRRAIRGFFVFNSVSAAALALYVACWALVAGPAAVLQATFISAVGPATTHGYAIRWQFWSQLLARNFMFAGLAAIAIVTLLARRDVPRHSRAIAIYSLVVALQCAVYAQPWPYFFVILFPTLFVAVAAFLDLFTEGRVPLWVSVTAMVAIIYPLHRVVVLAPRTNEYQKYNVELASALLEPGETYLAANDIIHSHEQAPARLARLGAQRIRELSDESRESHLAIVRDMRAAPPKLVIGNYRIFHLPPIILDHIDRSYARLSGSIRLYAPLVPSGEFAVDLKFGGRYRIEMQAPGLVSINGRSIGNGSLVHLRAGTVQIDTPSRLRLRLLPEQVEEALDMRYAAERSFYEHVYD